MSLDASALQADVNYPESDGQPMGDKTLQIRWIIKLFGGIDALFAQRADVFVAADPVEGSPSIVTAPDVMVAFGRPKGDRGSYKQWVEGGIPPQVVFEVLSFSTTAADMGAKLQFFEQYGVEEYYVYDPIDISLQGYVRRRGKLGVVKEMNGWVSPRLGIRFDLSGPELQIQRRDGESFVTYRELSHQLQAVRTRKEQLAAKLRELGIDPDSIGPGS
jgi:hypothetical protein